MFNKKDRNNVPVFFIVACTLLFVKGVEPEAKELFVETWVDEGFFVKLKVGVGELDLTRLCNFFFAHGYF